MDAKHTPGPLDWHGPYMAGAYKVSALSADDAILLQVYITGDTPQTNESNARLIAAAPDLLAALQECVTAFDNRDETTSLKVWNDRMREARDNARAALAKAGAQS